MRLKICGRWYMDVKDTISDQKWFLDWVRRSTKEASGHITQGWDVLWDLVESYGLQPASVVEYFGGLGCQSLMVEDLWPETKHTIFEVSGEAVDHIQATVGDQPDVFVKNANVYSLGAQPGELQLADFGDLTVWRMEKDKERSALLDGIFAQEPSAVVLTDIAGHYLHLHRDHYAPMLGQQPASYEEYLHLLGQYVIKRWGYWPALTVWQRWSAVTSYVTEPTLHIVKHVNDVPRGIEVVQ